jgi:SAM-dependent methyltransferase
MAPLLRALCEFRKNSTFSDSSFTLASLSEGSSPKICLSDRSSTNTCSSDRSSTQTIPSDVIQHTEADGRRYHTNDCAKYCHPLPSDERERERLLVQHELFSHALRGQLILAPILLARQNVLDVGTGFGCWAISLADHHPSVMVIGTDLTPIQPTSVPPNCKFQIHDAERLWNFTTSFKLVHLRYADTWVRDWPQIVNQTFEALKPGGWIELKFDLPWEYNTSTHHHTTIDQYHRDLDTGARARGITLHRDGTFYRRLLYDAGFVRFREKKFYLDSTIMRRLHHEEGLDTFGKGYIGAGLRVGSAELQVQLATVRNALQDSTLEIRFPVIVCYAQKPGGGVKRVLSECYIRIARIFGLLR